MVQQLDPTAATHAEPASRRASGGARAAGRGDLLLALDQGTTNTKALLVEAATGRVLAQSARRIGIRFPAPGWVEQDAQEIWEATEAAVDDVLRAADEPALAGVAISNQRESVAVWDADGAPLGPVLGWQDARTADACADLARREPGLAADVRRRTGLDLDPMFSAPKMRWLLEAADRPSGARLGTIDTYLLARLTGEHATEAGNASRTLLLDLASQQWDAELCAAFGVPTTALAPVHRSDALPGRTRPGGRIPAGVPVLAVLADSHAALFHHAGGRPGEGKATYGTGSSVMVGAASAESAPSGIAATLAWLTGAPAFAREGNIVASGAALTWMAQLLTGATSSPWASSRRAPSPASRSCRPSPASAPPTSTAAPPACWPASPVARPARTSRGRRSTPSRTRSATSWRRWSPTARRTWACCTPTAARPPPRC
ncbi:hypothetical protein GCM10025875_24860 [Litorihabitans aurantiacus]|uniref:Carbohydrate kinase FGGY N-terminal domain-containing protein n=1 Tax=Litorihabitans aurantiacus TaxID=1930061 RepID=A0AA37XG47_9MICO|nr:hypothetical protein GCM10025875_24860 [Litorihabitans aurantiacus]